MLTVKTWRAIPQRYRYEANKCKTSGDVFFPPRTVCPDQTCKDGNCTLEPVTMATEGKIASYTIIRVPPSQFVDEAPYAMAILEMDDGAFLTTQVVDCNLEDVKIGKRVKLEFRRIQEEGHSGVLAYGYKAVLI